MRKTSGLSIVSAIIAAALVVVWSEPAQANVRKVRNVLVLHSYHQGLQWTDAISQGIQTHLKQGYKELEIHFEYLDTKRNPGEDYFKVLVQFEHFKSRINRIDFELIIVSDNNALRFMAEYGQLLFPGVPVVFCGVNNFDRRLLKGMTDVTGVVESIDYIATIDLMRRLHPRRSRILVIVDNTPTGQAIKHEMDAVAKHFAPFLQFEFYRDFVLDEVPAKISTLGNSDLIYLLAFNRDREDNFISYADGIRMIRAAATVPIYGSWDFYFGNGIVGGMITSGLEQGRVAARLAQRILDGEPATSIPIVTRSPNRFMFDAHQLRRFGIERSRLPADSVIINQPVGWIERYKRQLAAGFFVMAAMALLLCLRIVLERRQKRRLTQINLELDRRVVEQTRDLQAKNEALESEVRERKQTEAKLQQETTRLQNALAEVRTLSGMLPICANCKKIRDDVGYWNQIEAYLTEHSDVVFSHGICPECARTLYPEL
jgi:ABC-type uncharacterized transport system substrate-binding protein